MAVTTRVAVVQFASGTVVEDNLATCLRMIDEAARCTPAVMVLPEFCNHISWYDDHDHARRVAVELEGEFLSAIAARAAQHRCHLVINVSLRNPDHLTVTSLMYGPTGDLLARADKQTLMGHENTWFGRATETSAVVDTAVGRLAMFPCRDGVTFETPRGLALRGAQLFCDSLNSFALDEASLHVPARAPENHCFLAAANKVGPLIPEALLDEVAAQTHIPRRFLFGAGESQIVSPQGEVLAKAPRDKEAVVWADLELEQANRKLRRDGTDMLSSRRPALYAPIAAAPAPLAISAAEEIPVACLRPLASGPDALEELPALLAALPEGTRLAVLPELAFCDWAAGVDDGLVASLCAALVNYPRLALATSLPVAVPGGTALAAVLLDSTGLCGQQLQLHPSERLPGLAVGNGLATIDCDWGRVALLTADDARYPELAKLAAIAGATTLVVPGLWQAEWEATLAMPSRAAENRLNVVYAAAGAGGLVAALERDFTLMTEWRERVFDGYINQPLIRRQRPGEALLAASIYPAAAGNKLMSEATDLIADRPWRLSGDLVRDDLS